MSKIKVLSRTEISKVLKMPDVIEAVKDIYIKKSEGMTETWPLIFQEFEPGASDMDIKSGYIKGTEIFGAKTVSWYGNNAKLGLPTLNGIITVFDGNTGMAQGLLEGAHITGMRTGAAGALGAYCLARKDAENLMILGAGHQALFQISAAITLLPSIKTVRIVDVLTPENAVRFAANVAEKLLTEFGTDAAHVTFEAANVEEAVRQSDIIITVTPSKKPVIQREWVQKGTHLSCIGSDMEGKEEIDPEIMKGARIFVDDKKQCMEVGEIEIPLKLGVISENDIAGEIGDILAGKIEGRRNEDEITIFDATGIAVLDLATAKLAIDAAKELGLGTDVDLL